MSHLQAPANQRWICSAAGLCARANTAEESMELAMIGLGKMGANMAQRLMRGGHRVVGFDPAEAARKVLEEKGGQSAASLGR